MITTKTALVKTNYGFTLIELLIVMSIIGVMLAGAFFAYIQIIERSRINQALSDIQKIREAVEAYHADTGFYPPDTSPLYDPGLINYLQSSCNPPTSSIKPCPFGYDPTVVEDPTPSFYRGSYLDEVSWPMETPWGGVYDYEYWPPTLNFSGLPGACGGMAPGIYISVRSHDWPWPETGVGHPSAFAEEYFRNRGQDTCAGEGNNGVIYYLVKPLR